MPGNPLLRPILEWYAANQRDLPWRRADATAWGVLVSEVMLQQTPVSRVLPVWEEWMRRWPVPADLATEPAGEAVRAWGRLGYPRRALRLHAAAQDCVQLFGGELPRTLADLRRLPGVGDYTAAAVASFAYRERHVVLDTNVRRVLARAVGGEAYEPAGAVTMSERRRAEELLPAAPEDAAVWSVAVMELGALVCRARTPACTACPIEDVCAWRAAGSPPWDGRDRRAQAYAGTDRQARGRLLAVLRDAPGPVPEGALAAAWSDVGQRERALATLLDDGLVQRTTDARYALPA